MSLNETPSAERIKIAVFGLVNVGKSSLINAITGQTVSLVSEFSGTTTDPVRKSMEIIPIGPVTFIDTAGLNDTSSLGKIRVARSYEILNEANFAILVTEASRELFPEEKHIISIFKEKKLSYFIVYNKSDIQSKLTTKENEIAVSAKTKYNIDKLIEKIATFIKEEQNQNSRHFIVADLISSEELTILIIPIDESAPKNRLILAQQQVMRELLYNHLPFIVCQSEELSKVLKISRSVPKLIITDSQKLGYISKMIPENMRFTSFSILFARYKGVLPELLDGLKLMDHLKDTDRVLISEACTHNRLCNDIGSVKLPNWIRQFCGANPNFDFTSGRNFPQDLTKYRLIIHCGACMLNAKEMKFRLGVSKLAKVPIINYGIAIAHMNGTLKRSIKLFPELKHM